MTPPTHAASRTAYRSGMSVRQFAKWAGIKYGTFITWVQKRWRKPWYLTGATFTWSQWLEALWPARGRDFLVQHDHPVRVRGPAEKMTPPDRFAPA
jgi:hypothetical protein